MGHSGDGCAMVVDKELDNYFGCGVCERQFLLPNNNARNGCAMVVPRIYNNVDNQNGKPRFNECQAFPYCPGN